MLNASGVLRKGSKGPLIECPTSRKLTVPDRQSLLTDGSGRILYGHTFSIAGVIKDTCPGNPRRGVLFVQVEHSPDCSECVREENRRQFLVELQETASQKKRLKDYVTDVLEFDPEALLSYVPTLDEAHLAWSRAMRKLDPTVILDHAEWWHLVRELVGTIREAPSERVSPGTADRYHAARKALVQAQKELAKSSFFQKCELVWGGRVRWTYDSGKVVSEKQEARRVQVNYPESPDGHRPAGFYEKRAWVTVGEGPPPSQEWVAECRRQQKIAEAHLEDAQKEFEAAREAYDKEAASVRERRRPFDEKINELWARVRETCPYK